MEKLNDYQKTILKKAIEERMATIQKELDNWRGSDVPEKEKIIKVGELQNEKMGLAELKRNLCEMA